MALWESARKFSESTAYPEHTFSYTESDTYSPHCVLCQQQLNDDAKDRLQRFEEFVVDDREDAAHHAEAERDRLVEQFRVMRAGTTSVALALQRIESDEAALAQVRQALAILDERRQAVLDGLGGGAWPEQAERAVDLGALEGSGPG